MCRRHPFGKKIEVEWWKGCSTVPLFSTAKLHNFLNRITVFYILAIPNLRNMKAGNPEKKKIVKLQISESNGFVLIGISSHENDYRLVWAMNNAFSFQFARIENLVIFNQKLNTDLEFSRFIFADEDKYLTYHLISNRCPDGFLFPEIKNLDYLLQITGEMDSKHLSIILKELKKVGIISAAFMIDPKQLKDAERKLH